MNQVDADRKFQLVTVRIRSGDDKHAAINVQLVRTAVQIQRISPLTSVSLSIQLRM